MTVSSRIPSSLKLAKREILAFFDARGGRAYLRSEINAFLRQKREGWKLAQRITVGPFIDFLLELGVLRAVVLRREPRSSETEGYGTRADEHVLHSWGEPSAYAMAQTLTLGGYLSHASAVFAHGLTDEIPKTFYINKEQTPKPHPKSAPTQERIDAAFKRRQRVSSLIYRWEDTRFVFLSGKNTENYGTLPLRGPRGEELVVSDLERTLVDITVRPAYAGGVHHVLEAFEGARERVSVAKLIATLKNLDHVYPYHQAVGFYLERAGVPASKLKRLRELGIEFNFYLGHAMPQPVLDPSWRVYYPQGL